MAMTYTEAAALERNNWFRERVRVAISTYDGYLLNTDPSDPDYQAKTDVAIRLANSADTALNTLMFVLSGDVEVQTVGPCIGDAQLQMIVEKNLKKFYPQSPAPASLLMRPPANFVPPPVAPAPPAPPDVTQ